MGFSVFLFIFTKSLLCFNMRKLLLLFVCILCGIQSFAFKSETKIYKLSDGERVLGRLCMPDSGTFNTVVFIIHGTGAQNHLNLRKGTFNFNFYDDLAEEFCSRGVAFFTYDRRGVTVDENGKPPFFSRVDSLKYLKYTPLREAEDVENMISSLKKDKHLRKCKFILYGLSEGTIIAPMVAEREEVEVDALFLHGYAHENMYDVIEWQNQGHGLMMMVTQFFDKDGDKKISAEEYNSENPVVRAYRNYLFPNTGFEQCDRNHDSFITTEDIGMMRSGLHEGLLDAISKDDNKWIRDNYMQLTSNWFKAHFQLEPNKTRLLRLTLPIYIFHGTHDSNVPVEDVYDIRERFHVANKTNLTTYVFEKHNHDLNYEEWLTKKEWSEGLRKIFDTAVEISNTTP